MLVAETCDVQLKLLLNSHSSCSVIHAESNIFEFLLVQNCTHYNRIFLKSITKNVSCDKKILLKIFGDPHDKKLS